MKVKSLSHVQLPATPWTAASQAPPSLGFSRKEYWSGLPLPSPYIGYVHTNMFTCVCTRVVYGCLGCAIYSLENVIHIIVCMNAQPCEVALCVTYRNRRHSKGTISGHHSPFRWKYCTRALDFLSPSHSAGKKGKKSGNSSLCNTHLPKLLYACFGLMDFTFITCHCLNPAQLVWQCKERYHFGKHTPALKQPWTRPFQRSWQEHFLAVQGSHGPSRDRTRYHPELTSHLLNAVFIKTQDFRPGWHLGQRSWACLYLPPCSSCGLHCLISNIAST